MKKIYLLTLVAGLMVFVSCNDDAADPANEITIDETTAPLANGYFIDIGTVQQLRGTVSGRTDGIVTEDHYTQFFFMTDGELQFEGEVASCVGCNWEVWVYAISSGPESFDPGDYVVLDWNTSANISPDLNYAYVEAYYSPPSESVRSFGLISEGLYWAGKSGDIRLSGGNNDRWTFRFNDLIMYDYNAQVMAKEAGAPSETVSASGRFSGEFTDATAYWN